MAYRSTKTFEHAFSCAFRQWSAGSHCRLLHGYALTVRIEFEADTLDGRNWVVDFGALKSLKDELARFFDHKLVVAKDDPHLDIIAQLSGLGVADVVVLDAVGCEAFALFIHTAAEYWLLNYEGGGRVRVAQVEVSEHGGNSAIYSN